MPENRWAVSFTTETTKFHDRTVAQRGGVTAWFEPSGRDGYGDAREAGESQLLLRDTYPSAHLAQRAADRINAGDIPATWWWKAKPGSAKVVEVVPKTTVVIEGYAPKPEDKP